ncbi:MAG: FtsX-like permease family protein [Roseivirga sp.]|nr:FtsX-like permease family protein [Roseivirga sp.]
MRDHIDDLLSEGQTERQAFNIAVQEFGEIKPMAQEVYWSQRPKSNNNFLINTSMLKNYVKIAVRNFMKYKFYTFVNVFGLTVGLSIVFLIGLFVNDELNFDKFHDNADNLYRVVENQYYAGQPVFPVAVTPIALGPSLLQEYPEVERFTRVSNEDFLFELGDGKILERGGIQVDEHFFEMFSFPIVKGSVVSFKEKLNTLILTEHLAEKYFPKEDPTGRTIKLDGEEFIVSAVIQDVPKNSHLDFNYIMNFQDFLADNPDNANNWGSNRLYTYVQLSSATNLENINEKIKGQIKRNAENSVTDIYLQPLTDIYLGEVDFVVEVQRKSRMMYVQVFSIVAFFILLISCINFMNLSTARSAKRAKEVGLRKTIGAHRRQLIFQFLSESVLLTLMAVVLSAGLVSLLIPSFNQLTDKAFDLTTLLNAQSGVVLVLGVLGMALLTGLLAGSYPALFLSSVKPVLALNSQTVSVKQGALLRKLLVVFQFVISVVLIIGTTTVYKQLKYIQTADLGYNKENIVYTSVSGSQSKLFADKLRAQPGVKSVGLSNRHPAYVLSSSSGFQWPGQNPDEKILMHFMGVDEHYMSTMQMRLIEGREFLEADTAVVMINQRAKEMMGLDEPIGKSITSFYGEARIVGMVNDFNFKSIHSEIEPIVIFKLDRLSRVYVKYEDTYQGKIAATMEGVWNELFPDKEYHFDFLQQDFDDMYNAEERTSKLSTYFAILAVMISCLGLFGLVSYATEQRTREIGIRKALGASVKTLFLLLTKDFAKLVLLSLLLSIPLGWYAMDSWLQNFAYHTRLDIGIFVISGIAALAITFVTVSYQSIRASTSSPVKALRNQ